jgi:hypothetical protein
MSMAMGRDARRGMPTDVEAASNRARDVAACELASTIHVRSHRGQVHSEREEERAQGLANTRGEKT